MQNKRELAIANLQLAINYSKKATAAFNSCCPDGSMTPDYTGKTAKEMVAIGVAIKDWGKYQKKSGKAREEFFDLYDAYENEKGAVGKAWPKDVRDMLLELDQSMPDVIRDTATLAFFSDMGIPVTMMCRNAEGKLVPVPA